MGEAIRGAFESRLAREHDLDYWRDKYERAAEERDDAERRLRDLAEQIALWAYSSLEPFEVVKAMYGGRREAGQFTPQKRTRGHGCVYYVRLGRVIKIGYTANFVSRMQQLGVTPVDVLAVEPGGIEMEQARHRQFDIERIGSTEMFQDSAPLLRHIEAIRDPSCTPWQSGVRLSAAVA